MISKNDSRFNDPRSLNGLGIFVIRDQGVYCRCADMSLKAITTPPQQFPLVFFCYVASSISTAGVGTVAKTIAELPSGAVAGSEDESIVPEGPEGVSPE